jgi:hypothetical protein
MLALYYAFTLTISFTLLSLVLSLLGFYFSRRALVGVALVVFLLAAARKRFRVGGEVGGKGDKGGEKARFYYYYH